MEGDEYPSGDDAHSYAATHVVKYIQSQNADDHLAPLPGSILDIGCGEGKDLAFFKSCLKPLSSGCQFYGVDISAEAIKCAQSLNAGTFSIRFLCQDWKRLDLPAQDIVVVSGLYHFLPMADRRLFAHKMESLIKPRGLLFLTTLSTSDTQYYQKGTTVENDPHSYINGTFLHFSTEEELRNRFYFLNIRDMHEFRHKNRAADAEFHIMWLFVGQKRENRYSVTDKDLEINSTKTI